MKDKKDKFEWLEKYFLELRFNDKHHLGLGDIRITLGQQDEILEILRKNHSSVETYRSSDNT